MADLGSSSWSEIDASNNAAPPNGWPEGMAPSDVNNSARAQMGGEKRWWDRSNSTQTTTGTSTAYVLTYAAAESALYDGEETSFVLHTTCGATPTLNRDGLGPKYLRRFDRDSAAYVAVAAGDYVTNQVLRVRYNLSADRYDVISDAVFGGDYVTLAGDNNFTGINQFQNALNEYKGADIASATTTDIGAATGNYVNVTGTTTITGLGTVQAGTERTVTFTGALTLTHNGTSLILPGAANITTAAGDTAIFRSLGSGNWKCVNYERASGAALVTNTTVAFKALANGVGAPGALAKMTLANASFNVGGYWDNGTQRFTPAAGVYSFQVALTTTLANSFLQLFLYKNGSPIGQADQGNSGNWTINLSVNMTDQANGTDYYEAYWAGGAIAVPTAAQAWFSAIGVKS